MKRYGSLSSRLVIIAVSAALLVGLGILLGGTVLAPQHAEVSVRENLSSPETHLVRNETFVDDCWSVLQMVFNGPVNHTKRAVAMIARMAAFAAIMVQGHVLAATTPNHNAYTG